MGGILNEIRGKKYNTNVQSGLNEIAIKVPAYLLSERVCMRVFVGGLVLLFHKQFVDQTSFGPS